MTESDVKNILDEKTASFWREKHSVRNQNTQTNSLKEGGESLTSFLNVPHTEGHSAGQSGWRETENKQTKIQATVWVNHINLSDHIPPQNQIKTAISFNFLHALKK